MKMRGKMGMIAGAVAGGYLLGTAALYQGLVVRRYGLTTDKWAEGGSQRFVMLSDLHSTSPDGLLELVRRQGPDYILLAGDILDERYSARPVWPILRGLAAITHTYYALGNHEYRTYSTPRILRHVRSCGVHTLVDRFARLQTPAGVLIIAGGDDMEKAKRGFPRYDQRVALNRAFARLDGDAAYKLLMIHRPEGISLYRELDFDLIVSGHAHGGQARVPYLINGVLTPSQGLFPTYAGGCYDHGDAKHIVGRGLVVHKTIPRVFNPPEVVVVDVMGSGQECGGPKAVLCEPKTHGAVLEYTARLSPR